jgi:hypothetical protein
VPRLILKSGCDARSRKAARVKHFETPGIDI